MAKIPELFFDCDTKQYWLPINGRFRQLDKKDAALHLIHAGLDPDTMIGRLKAIDRAYFVAQTERAVEYAGPLAGHKVGLSTMPNGERVLVTSEAKPIEAKAGPIPHWEKLLSELLPDDQWQRLVAWVKFARRAQRRGDFMPGQCLVLIGPPGCGKSWLQQLITLIFGGRHADPYDYMTGKTNFNSDLAKAEHWLMEDKVANIGIGARLEFAERLKQATVNTFVRIHGKGKEGKMFALFRRMSSSANDEAENVMRFPPLVKATRDKLLMLKCSRAELSNDYTENRKRFESELPAFCHFADSFKIPKRWLATDEDFEVAERFGIPAWQHPWIVEVLSDSSPESRLLNLIDQIFFTKPEGHDGRWQCPDNVQGNATELEMRLRSCFPLKDQVTSVLSFSSAFGVYLARLAVQHPTRFEARKLAGKTRWIIRAP